MSQSTSGAGSTAAQDAPTVYTAYELDFMLSLRSTENAGITRDQVGLRSAPEEARGKVERSEDGQWLLGEEGQVVAGTLTSADRWLGLALAEGEAMRMAFVVAAGDAVGAGSVLGTIEEVPGGLSHCPGSSCLHLGARSGEDYLDPLLLLGVRGPSVLVRWDGAGSTAPGAGAALLGTGTTGGAVTGGVAGAGDGATSTVGPSAGSGRASGAASSPTRTGRAVPLHASSA